MIERTRQFWKQDAFRKWLLVGGFLYALFMVQGIPFWDDDFTSWFWKVKDKNVFQLIFEWISPISTQPEYWGFNERPLQALIYKISYLIAGYDAWPYMIFKSLVYSGLGVMIYLWSLRLVPKSLASSHARWVGTLAAIFFLLTPGPFAALLMYQDFAPVAELIFLAVTYVIWDQIEKTPTEWTGRPNLKDPAQKSWVIRWSVIAFCTYLGYKSKADLKLIPAILAAYVLLARRSQKWFFAVPVGLMGLLAVPWGKATFQKLPPFVPGSGGSEIGWMWQPASFERVREFVWASGNYDFFASLREPTISLAGLLGPFLLIGILAFLVWRMEGFDKVPWRRLTESSDRARLFILLWFLIMFAGASALPAINYTFRIRYGILLMVPVAILLAWVFGLFADSLARLPKWVAGVAIALLAVQSGINMNRSIAYRRDMGQVMVAVDQVYEHFSKNFAGDKLTLLPDFRPYDYRPDGPKTVIEREWLGGTDDLVRKHRPMGTYVVSWNPSLWDQLEMVSHHPGCRSSSLFDRIFPCPAGTGTYLMKYIGENPLYKQGEEARARGDVAGARNLHEQFLKAHPNSLAGYFVVGLEAYQQKDWVRSQQAYAELEKYFPNHLSIVYNHALALEELKEHKPAIERLKFIVAKEPNNYAAQIHLFWNYEKSGEKKRAKQTLTAMKRLFPDDPDVTKLLTTMQ